MDEEKEGKKEEKEALLSAFLFFSSVMRYSQGFPFTVVCGC